MNDEKFVFIFAESVLDAVIHYVRTYRIPPLNCHEYSLDIEIIKKNEVMTFREMKKQHFKFPAITGVYLRDNF